MADQKIPKPKNRIEQEEQYFAEQEQLKRKALREKLNEKREAQKENKCDTWMKCPKCGGDMEEKSYADVVIDKCKSCKGVYLDDGELELLLEGRKAKGFISKFMESITGE